MPFPWSSRATHTLSAAAMSALLLASAMKHFREPSFFYSMVPDFLCRRDEAATTAETPPPNGPLAVMSREEWIAASGLLEAGAAVGLLVPATRKSAAVCTAAMFTVFVAGHADSLRKAYGPDGSAAHRQSSAARLSLQVPLILWAWSLRSSPTRPARNAG